MESASDSKLQGSGRSVVVGNDKSTSFIVGFEHPQKEKRITRLKQYPKKEITAEEIDAKQKAAADRKQKADETKKLMAKKVREEAEFYDKKVRPAFETKEPRWFEKGFKK